VPVPGPDPKRLAAVLAAVVVFTACLPALWQAAQLNRCGVQLAPLTARDAGLVSASACFGAADDPGQAVRLEAVANTKDAVASSSLPARDLDALASFAAQRGALSVARQLADRALLIDPADAQAQLRLGDALTCRLRQPWGYDRVLGECGANWPAAIDAYQRAAADGLSGEAYMALALAEHESGALSAAAGDLDRSLARAATPQDRYYRHTLMGDWQLAAGSPGLAAESYRAAGAEGFPVSSWWRSQYALALAQSVNG
jgi:hypothetical protein